MKHFVLIGLMAATALIGCKKDSDDPATPTPSAKTTALLNKRWGLTAVTAQQGSMIEDVYAQLPACGKDNYLRFNEDRTLEANEGPLKCDAADPQARSGNWELVSNESKLLITTPIFGAGGAAIPDIIELSATRMVLRATIIESGVTTTLTATLTPY